MKKILISLAIVIAAAAIAVFIYRYQILQYSAETIIRKSLPGYIKIDKINFRPQEKKLILNGFRILNPPGFSSDSLLNIGEIVCSYRMKGKSISDGIEVMEPVFTRGVLNIERLANGELNLVKMREELDKHDAGSVAKDAPGGMKAALYGMVRGRKVPDIVTLPENFLVKNSRAVFTDRFNRQTPVVITFDNVNSILTLKLNDLYSRVLSASSSGEGDLNGKRDEVVKWQISLNPTTPKLTMSSRFDVSGLSIPPFEPYYGPHSPLGFESGRFSGTLVFDFDNGNIGSTNELHLSEIKFYVKPGYENAQFWETTVPDLVKYFTSTSGEIIFDFKIKGDISKPKFYLGPISKQALVNMAVDKISAAVENMSNKSQDGAPTSDMEKAKEYINLFKGMINKK